jgi:hypothetical protein
MNPVCTRLGFLLLAAGWLAATPVAAQEATGPDWSSRAPPRLSGGVVESMVHFRDFTNCLVTLDWPIARGLFETRIGSPEERSLIGRLGGGRDGSRCLIIDRMRVMSTLLRGGIAQARYRRIYASSAPPPLREPAPVPEGAQFSWVPYVGESPAPALYAFANCVARRDPGGVNLLLGTQIGANDERDAMQALSRGFGACLAVGQDLRAYRLTLRFWLAEAQYQSSRSRQPDVGE